MKASFKVAKCLSQFKNKMGFYSFLRIAKHITSDHFCCLFMDSIFYRICTQGESLKGLVIGMGNLKIIQLAPARRLESSIITGLLKKFANRD